MQCHVNNFDTVLIGTCSFICQSTLTRRQRSDLFVLQTKLPPVTPSITTQS